MVARAAGYSGDLRRRVHVFTNHLGKLGVNVDRAEGRGEFGGERLTQVRNLAQALAALACRTAAADPKRSSSEAVRRGPTARYEV